MEKIYKDKLISFVASDNNTIVLDNVFVFDSILEYAVIHKFNVLFTETSCAIAVKIIHAFCEAGFKLVFVIEPVTVMGLQIEPNIYCKFVYNTNVQSGVHD